MVHYYENKDSDKPLCGMAGPTADGSDDDCLECDRIVRNRTRASYGLPPLTDAEFAEIHKRRINSTLVVCPDENGRL